MSVTLTADVLEDEIAVSVARALTAADQRAREFGVDAQNSLITITQTDNGLCWRVNYGARDYIERRGGDLIIDVDANDAHIRQVLQGQ